MENYEYLHQSFKELYGKNAEESFFSPGRVNLIGEHIDYNGGFVLPAAISLGITALVSRRNDTTINIFSQDFKEKAVIDISKISQNDINKHHIKWPHYIIATLLVLKENGVSLLGADIILSSTLPLGTGLSSSAALECLIAYIFNHKYYQQHKTTLALDAQRAERQYVGVNCGIMDQFAVANGKQEHAILLNCANLEFEYIPAVFNNYKLVIINSNKKRTLADSKYNERRSECDAAYKILSKFDVAPDLCNVHEISLAHLEDDILYQRTKHAILENKRVKNAVVALKQGNIDAFGQLLTASHISLDKDYEVSCHELNMIVHYSTHFEGCIGARMTGAGFGGCCIALVENDSVEKFINYVGKKYIEKTDFKADFYLTDIVNGVTSI